MNKPRPSLKQLQRSAPQMYDALLHINRMVEEALPKFNWGDSFLDANAIQLLNEAPIVVKQAIMAAGEP